MKTTKFICLRNDIHNFARDHNLHVNVIHFLSALFSGRNSVYTVQSTLRFAGRDRPDGNQLVPADRGVYACVFENEVKRAETTMHLRIERMYFKL